ncbi:ATPase, T2SS/T4P/T4SS family (plasmid) [Rhodobacter capsulatus]|uniref:ATPase, T2SS/T4P/T4SS family n=1 Tax=Rhodobacter capsulatus TaxID=1061 RepID=UPI004024F151
MTPRADVRPAGSNSCARKSPRSRRTPRDGDRDPAGCHGHRCGCVSQRLVTERLNIIVSGGTSTGKTELGRRLLSLVPENERIVTIEDSLELLPAQPNAVSLIAQRDDGSARSADKLLQATLRLRPDRIILGELRGSEAATFLDAINTGHSGSFTTLHAHSARKAMDRLALLVMAQGTRLGFAEVIRYLQSSIDVILQMGRDGERRGIMEMYFPGLDD